MTTQESCEVGRRAFLILVGLLLLQCEAATGLRVLVVATMYSESHYIWCNALTEGLLAQGHQVVEFTKNLPAAPHPNRTTFAYGNKDGVVPDTSELVEVFTLDLWTEMRYFMDLTLALHRLPCETRAFGDIVAYLKANKYEKFDVMIHDYAYQEFLIGIAGLAGRPPIVAVTAFLNPVPISRLMGNPLMPSVVPHDSAYYSQDMSFSERVDNLLRYLVYLFGDYFFYQPAMELMYREFFGDAAPSMEELSKDVALALVNSHPAIHGSIPLVPSIVEVGLLHARPGRPLPNDLMDWVDGAKDGFVYMSLGTITKSSSLKPEIVKAIIKAFGEIKQRVIWKFETDAIDAELPSNVRVFKWLPQNDILAHPNCRVFVSHCGGQSFHELSYHGVPLVGIPLCLDQFANARKSETLGLGKILKLADINYNSFSEALNEVIGNPKYRESARRLSQVLRNQKETPLERAVWWVEYVGREGGAPHLRSHALQLHWTQLYLLDVAAALLVGPLFALWLLCRLCRRTAGRGVQPQHQKRD